LEDPPKSPLKKGTLNGSLSSLKRRVREDQKALKQILDYMPERFQDFMDASLFAKDFAVSNENKVGNL